MSKQSDLLALVEALLTEVRAIQGTTEATPKRKRSKAAKALPNLSRALYVVIEERLTKYAHPCWVKDGKKMTTWVAITEVIGWEYSHPMWKKLLGYCIHVERGVWTKGNHITTDDQGIIYLPKKGPGETLCIAIDEVEALLPQAWPKKGKELLDAFKRSFCA